MKAILLFKALKDIKSPSVFCMIQKRVLSGSALLSLIALSALLPGISKAQSDDCANATLITDVNNWCSAAGAYTNVGATASGMANPACWTGTVPNEVWFRFTAVGSVAFITVTGSGGAPQIVQPRIALYSDNCTGTITTYTCANGTPGSGATQLYQGGLTPGTSYLIRITSTAPNAGKFKLCLNSYTPPQNPGADCSGATKLCDKNGVSVASLSGGGANTDEAETTSCMEVAGLADETNSAWYVWQCDQAGTLTFDIVPVQPSQDIDFILYELAGSDPCGTRTVLRCNASSCTNTGNYAGLGSTGLNPADADVSENTNCDAGENAYCSPINMVAGKYYAILINNASQADGFTLNFGGTGTFKGGIPVITTDRDVICTGQTITYDGSASTGYTSLNWNFSSGSGTPSTATGPGPHTVTYNTAGTFTGILNAVTTGCPLASKGKTIVVKQSPTNPVASSANVCSGDQIQLNSTTSTGVYSWTGPNSFTSTSQNPTIANSTSANSGTYSVNATLNGCTSPTSSVNVTVVQRKSAGIDKSITVCNSQASVDLFANLGGTPDGGGTWSVVGTVPSGYSNTSTLNTNGVAPGTYVFKYSFTGLTPCPDVSAQVSVTINKAAIAGNDKTWNVCGNDTVLDLKTQLSANAQSGGVWSKNGSFGGSLDPNTGIFDTQAMVEGTYKFQYTVSATSPCVIDVADITLRTVRRPYAGKDSTYNPLCQSDGSIDVKGALGTNADATGTWSGGSVAADGTVNISSMKGSFTYTYTSTSSNTAVCPTDQAVVKFDVNDAPTFTVDPVLCNSTNDKISIKINMAGGQSTTYNLVISPSVSGTRTGNTYSTGPINPGTYQITLTDAKGCGPVATQTVSKVCNCTTDAGDMTPTTGTLRICGPGPATATHVAGSETLDGNDVLSYVIHTSPNNNLGTIYGRSTTSTFSLDLAAGMQYDVTYYISAIAGNKDASNQVDLANANFCNSVAPGRPVIWRQLPFASMVAQDDSICNGQSTDLVFTLGVNGPFTVTLSDNTSIPNLTTAANHYTVTPTTIGTNTYTGANVTDTYGCVTSFTSPVTVELLDRPVIDLSSVVTTCNNINTGYTVQFKVSNGDKASYVFSGTPGTWDPSTDTFTSSLITNNATYTFIVTDVYGCNPDQISNSHFCPCTTNGGSMSNTSNTLEFCQSQSADVTGVHNGDQVLDGNDVLNYILATNPNNVIGTKLAQSTQPVFPFQNGYAPGTTYYICPIAGDDDGTGMVDLVNGCHEESPGTPVRWLPSPSVSIVTSVDEICSGTSAAMTLNVNSYNARNVDFTVNAQGFSQAFSINSSTPLSISDPSPSLAGDTIRAWIDNATVQYTVAPFCKGSWIPVDTQKVFVVPRPTATLTSVNHILCPRQSMPLNFSTTGHGNVTVNYTGGNFTVPAGAPKQVALPNFNTAGSYSYSITSVSSTSALGTTCSGMGSGTVNFDVKGAPTASASFDPPVICFGQSSALKLTASGATPDFTVYYRSNGTKRTQLVPPAGSSVPYTNPTSNVDVRLDSVVDATVSSANGKGCAFVFQNPSSVSLTVNTLPVAVISGGGPVCEGTSANVNFNVTGASPFRIVYSDGVIDPAQNSETRVKTPTVTTTYTLTSVRDANGCMATNMSGSPTITVNPIPVPDFTADDFSSCPPLQTILRNTTDYSAIGTDATCEWDIQGRGIVNSCGDQNVSLAEPGFYDIKLTVTSAAGCSATKVENNYLRVNPFPKAAFSYTPEESTVIDTRKEFINLSELADTSWWYFYDAVGNLMDSLNETGPGFTFPSEDSGTYRVVLRTATRFGCGDQTGQIIHIKGEMLTYTPNAFSPNGDNINDVFRPSVRGDRPEFYELYIFNRWGEKIFYSKDPAVGWDGTYRGEPVEVDVYLFRLILKSAYDAQKQEVIGKVSLIR